LAGGVTAPDPPAPAAPAGPAPPAAPADGLSLLRAFVWLRWRTLANSLTARRRTTWQRLGAVAEVVGRGLVALVVLGLSLGGVAFGLILPALLVRMSAETTESGLTRADGLLLVVRVLLAFFLLIVLLVPAIQGLLGSGLPRARLLLLPIRLRLLHAVETAAHLADPWVLPLVPALLAVAAGAAWVAGAGGLVVLAAGLLLVLAVAALSATVTFGVGLLLRDRRRAEALALVVMLLWITVALLPSWIDRRLDDEAATQETAAGAEAPSAAADPGSTAAEPGPAGADPGPAVADPGDDRVFRALADPPAAVWLIPSEAYARALGLAVLGRPAAALGPTAVLALTGLLLYGLSRLLWRRLLASPAASGGRRGPAELPRPFRVPGLSAAASAVAWGQLVSVVRTLAGRLGLLVAPVLTVMLGTVLRSEVGEMASIGRAMGSTGGVVLGAGAVALAMLSMQTFLVNQFALDGPGFVLTSLAPADPRDVVLGKWVAWAGLAGGLTLVTTGVVMILAPEVLPWWPALLLGGVGVFVVLALVGTWLSLAFPKAVDLNRLGRDARPNQLAMLLIMLATGVAVGLPFLVGGLVWAITGSRVAVTAVAALWTAAALLLARFLLGPVARALAARREGIYLALQEGRKG
jgi:hypothetical protein